MTDSGERVDPDGLRMREPDGWTHHVLDLDGDTEIRTTVLDRPLGKTDRARAVKAVVGNRTTLSADAAAVSDGVRQLSPRQPYQASPLSYLEATGRCWTVLGEGNRLEWFEFGAPNTRPATLTFFFHDVAVGTALVSLNVRVRATPGVTGFYEVRSDAAPPRLMGSDRLTRRNCRHRCPTRQTVPLPDRRAHCRWTRILRVPQRLLHAHVRAYQPRCPPSLSACCAPEGT